MLHVQTLVAARWAHRVRTPSGAGRRAAGDSMFSALRYRNYRLFWFGQLVSVTGTFMQGTAQQWLVLTLTPNPMALGLVGALQFGPILLLGPLGGVIVDRWPRRVVLMVTQGCSGVLAAILWALTALGIAQIWQVFALALALGLVNSVDMPARQAFVSEMVPRERLLNAVSLNSAQFNVSRILGPGLAGAIIALFHVPVLFLLNAVSYIAVIIGLMLMRPAELVPVPRAMERGVAALRAMGAGGRFVWDTPVLRLTMVLVAVIGTFGFNFNVLLPLEATNVLRAGPAVFGLLTSALGIGALAGALLLAWRGGAPSNTLLVGTAAGFGVIEAAVALTRAVPVAMLLFAATGFCMSSFAAAANTRMQLASPPELRGRVMSVYMMIFNGTAPIGNLLTSGVASTGGVPLSFVVAGVPSLAVALAAAWLWRAPGARVAAVSPATGRAFPARLDTTAAPPMTQTATLDAARAGVIASGRTYPGRAPTSVPGHPAPQPRAADAE